MGKNKNKYRKNSSFRWVCLSINERYSSCLYHKKVESGIAKIFGDDQKEIVFIGNILEEDVIENILDTYVFINCANIEKYVSKLEKCKYIKKILNSYDNIIFIDEEDIRILRTDWNKKKKKRNDDLFFGDVVEVKYGMYQSLKGIILDFDKKYYSVLFKFCAGYDLTKLRADNLIKLNNIFDIIKVPYMVTDNG